jgi:hypothetical protein
MSAANARLTPPQGLMAGLRTTAVLGGLVFLLGLFVDPRRAWGGYLMGFVYFVELGLAGGFFLTVLSLTGARWATALRRIPEAMTSALPVGALLGLGLIAGVHSLYEWSHASVVASDPLLAHKAGYLNWGFFAVRLALYFALWIALTRGMVAVSRRQDEDGDPRHARRLLMLAVCFLPVFALTFSLASVDWLESLEPHWFSTIYALGTLSSLGTSGLALCIVLAVYLRRGPLRGVLRADHLDDLGKIGIALALFWGYIWYCQYMLIWYTDMPEETPYYFLRAQGGWESVSAVNVLLNWAIPFFALMPRAARRNDGVLLRVAAVMLLGQALNLYMLVQPGLQGARPLVGPFEIGPLVGAVALFVWLTLRALSQAPLVPVRDPHLTESLAHES